MIGAAIRKDMLLLARDRGALASLFLLPLIFIGVFGSIFTGGGDRAPASLKIAIAADEPHSELTQRVLTELAEQPQIELVRVKSVEQARRAVEDDEVAVALVLPRDFSPLLGKPGRMLIDADAPPQERAAVEGAVQGIVTGLLLGRSSAMLFEIEPAQEGRTELASGFQISVPGNAVLFGFFLALTVALSFLEDRRTGVFRRLMSSPVRRSTLLLAKLVPFAIIGMIQMTFLFGFGALVFGLELGASVPALVLLTAAIVLCAVSLGLFMASFGGTEKQLGGIGSICLLVMGLLGGAMVPRMVMPSLMKSLGKITPHAWALDGYQALLVDGGALQSVLGPVLVILAFSAGFALIGVVRFRFE